MCGIAGLKLANARPEIDWQGLSRRMAQMLRRRGPDGQGHVADPGHSVTLVQTRLAILDTSDAGQAPMATPDGRYVLVFNGEIYNHAELRRELDQAGAPRGHRNPQGGLSWSTGDTEVLLHALQHWGVEETLPRLRGMFAWAWYDRHTQRLTLARDRMGEKPLLAAFGSWGWAFGSHLGVLMALRPEVPALNLSIDPQALSAYLARGWTPADRSLLEGVRHVPPGHVVQVDEQCRVQSHAWWTPDWAARQAMADRIHHLQEAREALIPLIRASVRERLVSDVPVGAFLSGGIDSSLICAAAQSVSGSLRTYAMGFDVASHDESDQAQAVADRLGTDHRPLVMTGMDARHLLPQLPDILDEPMADASILPTAWLAHHASREVKVALTGDGGDELFGGYERYRMAGKGWRRLAALPAPWRHTLADGIAAVPPGWWEGCMQGLPRRYRPTRMASKAAKLSAWLRADTPSQRTASFLVIDPRHAEPNEPEQSLPCPADGPWHASEAMQLWEQTHYLPGDLLTKMDRGTMWASLEARSPLLDPRIIDLSWRIAARLKAAGASTKTLLRDCLSHWLPPSLFDRPKQGFSVPLSHWLQGPLRLPAQSLVEAHAARQSAWVNAADLHREWSALQKGRTAGTDRLWSRIVLELWLQRHGLTMP